MVLILLRGQPGWFLRPGDDSASILSGGNVPRRDGGWETIARVGPPNRPFDLVWNGETRILRLEGLRVTVGDDNVILVDGAGSDHGLRS